VSEVYVHIANGNFLLLSLTGVRLPADDHRVHHVCTSRICNQGTALATPFHLRLFTHNGVSVIGSGVHRLANRSKAVCLSSSRANGQARADAAVCQATFANPFNS